MELFARASAVLEKTGESSFLSTTAAYHAHALLLTGNHDAARQQLNLAIASASTDDVFTHGLASSVRAWLAAIDGEAPDTVRQHMTDALAAPSPLR